MQAYKDYAPTQFDVKGLALYDRGDWLVVPCGRTRDSDPLAESNFAAALTALGGEGDDVEVHRFRHWACGWLEIIIVRPETAAAEAAAGIEAALADCPILDEDDFLRREYDLACEIWEQSNVQERVEYIRRYGQGCSVFAARRDDLPSCIDVASLIA